MTKERNSPIFIRQQNTHTVRTIWGRGGGGRERESERQTDRQTNRQTDRQTELELENFINIRRIVV